MKHNKYFEIAFRDVDQKGYLKMSALVDHMQETSNEHAALLGIDFQEAYEGHPYYWIVSRAKMCLETYPKWKDKIRIETYPVGADRLFAVRRFNIYNEQDEQMGYIIGYYIVMDGKQHRPVRLKTFEGDFALFREKYEGEELPKLELATYRHREDVRKVRSGEIDSNNHMNNAHYIRWTSDLLTCEELLEHPIRSIQTNYITSLVEGDEVKVILTRDSNYRYIAQGMDLEENIIYWTSELILHE
ncbi:MAG: acyl-[acyl-carrier-protein] thioesterase [Cellulosilyticaceae bacterium]